jgi:hypothetical protein
MDDLPEECPITLNAHGFSGCDQNQSLCGSGPHGHTASLGAITHVGATQATLKLRSTLQTLCPCCLVTPEGKTTCPLVARTQTSHCS